VSQRENTARRKRRLPGRRWRILAQDVADCIDVRNRGQFDEIVIDRWLHLEWMSDRHYWMQLGPLRIDITLGSNGACDILIERDYEMAGNVSAGLDVRGVSPPGAPPWWVEDPE
jgi:hypothetical protein